MRYKPFGEVRYTWKASQTTTPAYALSRFTFTGQYSYMDDPSTSGVTEGFGLMFYNARWYDPALGRFAQADTIVPPGVQGLDRYAYTLNNPIRYIDPSGHKTCEEDGYNCFDKRQNLINRIEQKFNVEIKGPWIVNELQNLETALNKFANQIGGSDNFNEMVATSLKENNINSENVIMLRAKDDSRCIGSGGCWKDGNLVFNDRAFTPQYQQNRGPERRPPSLGFGYSTQDSLNLSVQATITHEMMHMYADANPSAVSDYILRVSNIWAFSGSFNSTAPGTTVQSGIDAAEESMASAGAIYIVTNGAPYPSYQDQMDFVFWLFNH